jgi:hypothetical protein
MIDTTLIDTLTRLAEKENKVKEYRRRLRVKGEVSFKGMTKSGNLTLTVREKGEEYKYTILRSHKDRHALAEKIPLGRHVSIEGIPKFRYVICTRLKALDKGLAKGKQEKLEAFTEKSDEKNQ